MANDIQAAAADVVERSRLGDQNAMALITRVKEEADKGSDRAIQSYTAIMAYIETHPAKGHGFHPFQKRSKARGAYNFYAMIREASRQGDVTSFAGDVMDLTLKAKDPSAAGVALADGRLMTRKRIAAISKLMGDEKEQKLFIYCVTCTCGNSMRLLNHTLPPEGKKIAHVGQAVGIARKIQGVRSGKMPLRLLSPMVAWELGQ